jgi:hypothetical protein
MFEGLFEWVMGIITYVLSFFGIKVTKPVVVTDSVNVVEENVEMPAAMPPTMPDAMLAAMPDAMLAAMPNAMPAAMPSNSSE